MGNRISAAHGVRSPNLFSPGNAVNEIWFDNVEVISRLPFGDSDMGQAAWPKNDYPKIPWHPFIIPLRAAATKVARTLSLDSSAASITRRSLSSMPPNGVVAAINNAIDPCCILLLLLLAIPFLVAPIVIYHSRRTYCGSCQLSASRHHLDCAKPKRHAAVAHALLAQALGDAGLSLMYGSLLVMNDGTFRIVGDGSKVSVSAQLVAQLVALVSRAYLLCIWYQYLRAHWLRRGKTDGLGDHQAEETSVDPVSEKLDSSGVPHAVPDPEVDVENRKEHRRLEKCGIV